MRCLQRTAGWSAVVVSWTVTLALPIYATQVSIDDFQNAVTTKLPPGIAVTAVSSVTTLDPNVSGVLGGIRSLTVEATSLDFPGFDNVTAGAGFQGSFLEYRSTVGADGRIELLYDAGGAGLNASFAVTDVMELVVLKADSAATPYTMTLTFVDDVANSASVTQLISTPGPISVRFSLAAFQGVNVGKVFSIKLVVDPMAAGDLRFMVFRSVTPKTGAPLLSLNATAALVLVLGLVGAAGVLRTRLNRRPSRSVAS